MFTIMSKARWVSFPLLDCFARAVSDGVEYLATTVRCASAFHLVVGLDASNGAFWQVFCLGDYIPLVSSCNHGGSVMDRRLRGY